MATLERQFRSAVRTINQLSENGRLHKGNRYPLQMELWVIVLYGAHRGWTEAMMARVAKTTVNTIRKCRSSFQEDPSSIFRVPVLTMEMRWKMKVWRCQFCESVIAGSERKAREHVANHLLIPIEIRRGVMPLD